MIEFEDLPQFAGGPAVIANPILLLEDGEFRVYGTELEIMWRWDLYKNEEHLHTGCAQRPESCVVSAKGKISFFRRPTVMMLMNNASSGTAQNQE